jgi:hypothetical protein
VSAERTLEIAEYVIRRIEKDIKDRRGLKWEWGAIDEDVKDEIRRTWHRFIVEEIEATK